MTASRSDRRLILAVVVACGCRPSLPAEPPGSNAADPDAPASKYAPAPNPYERSAFDGVEVDAGGHSGHGHHHGHKGGK